MKPAAWSYRSGMTGVLQSSREGCVTLVKVCPKARMTGKSFKSMNRVLNL